MRKKGKRRRQGDGLFALTVPALEWRWVVVFFFVLKVGCLVP